MISRGRIPNKFTFPLIKIQFFIVGQIQYYNQGKYKYPLESKSDYQFLTSQRADKSIS